MAWVGLTTAVGMLPQISYVLLFVLASTSASSASRLRTRLTSSLPTDENASSILRLDGHDNTAVKQLRFNHDRVGITRPVIASFPSDLGDRGEHGVQSESFVVDGWRVLRFTARVGAGKVCYRQARDAALEWSFHSKCGKKSMGIVSVNAKRGCLGESASLDVTGSEGYSRPRKSLLATFTELALPFLQIYVVNPIHTVYEKVDWRHPKGVYSCTSYATLRGHLLSGEERVLVSMRSSGEVDVEIVSFSRAGPGVVGKIVWPFIGRMQRQFFLREIDHLAQAAVQS